MFVPNSHVDCVLPLWKFLKRHLSTIADQPGEIIPFLVSLSSLLLASANYYLVISHGKREILGGSGLLKIPGFIRVPYVPRTLV